MKKIISNLIVISLLSYSTLYGYIAVNETIGPHDYRTTYAEIFAPLSRSTTVSASYTSSSYSGSSSRISYGGEVNTKVNRNIDAGAGFILSPERGGLKYTAWDVSGGYTFGERDFKVRLGMYFQDTIYEQQTSGDSRTLNQYIYCPSIKLTILRSLKIGFNTALFTYSENVNSFGGSVEPWSLRNNRDLGGIIGVVGDFPSRTETIGVAYRIVKPLEVYGEWSRIFYERSSYSDTLNAFGMRYFLTENFAFSVNFIAYNDETYNTLGFGLYW
ncbi:MAG: hypothetical protein NT145_08665 [Elusimicrobia bacterium]|nr:hypothetical protein [Elusimicrobiota bacterium]